MEKQSVLPPPSIRPKTLRTAQLAVPPAQAEARLDDIAEQALDEAKRYSSDPAPLFALVAKTRELSGR